MITIKNIIRKISSFSSSDTIFLNADGSILIWNDKLEKMKGLAEREAIGRNYSILYDDEVKEKSHYQALLQKAAKSGSITHTFVQKHQDGKIKKVNRVVTSIKDEQKEVIGFTIEKKTLW